MKSSIDSAPRQQVVLLEPPDRAALDVERTQLLAEIEAALPREIVTADEYAAVADLELRVGRFLTKTEPLFDGLCADAHRTWKSACKIRSLFLDAPRALKARARDLLGAFVAREERERRDRERAIAIAERQREAARVQEEARSLDDAGQHEIADAVRSQPIDVAAVALPSAVPDVGLTYRDEWYWEPVGGDTPANRLAALARLVKAEWLPLLALNDAGLTQFAKRTKGTVIVPGIVFRSRKVPVRR